MLTRGVLVVTTMGVGAGSGASVGVGVGVWVGTGSGVGVSTRWGVCRGIAVGVWVGLFVCSDTAVGASLMVGVATDTGVGVEVGTWVEVGDREADGVIVGCGVTKLPQATIVAAASMSGNRTVGTRLLRMVKSLAGISQIKLIFLNMRPLGWPDHNSGSERVK